MNKLKLIQSDNFRLWNQLIFVFSIALFLFLLFRGLGLYPAVFADEYTYSKFSRLLPLSEAEIPGYLFLSLYRVTNFCGDGFLACAKALNVLVYALSIPFLYSTAKRFCSSSVAAIFAIVAICAPFSSYTAYFMPESLYFLFFWIVTWSFFRIGSGGALFQWGGVGALVGLFSLVKPHALFIVPAYVGYVAFVGWSERASLISTVLRAISFLAAIFLVKIGIGFLVAGPEGVSLFGSSYSSIADSAAKDLQHYVTLLLSSLNVFQGHALALLFLFGVPLVSAFCIAGGALIKRDYCLRQNLSVYMLLVLSSLVFVTCLFTVSVADTGPYETITRLHMRYYNFLFPLLVLVVAAQLSFKNPAFSVCALLLVAPVALGILYVMAGGASQYVSSHIDNPEWRGTVVSPYVFKFLGFLSLTSVVLWGWKRALGNSFYVYVFFPVFVFLSSYFVVKEQQNRLVSDSYDSAGIFAKQFLSRSDLNNTVIVGSQPGAMFRTLFYFDSVRPAGEVLRIIPDAAVVDTAALQDKDWALILGDHQLAGEFLYRIPMNGFSLVRISRDSKIDFSSRNFGGLISRVDGLSTPEAWGAWSLGEVVRLEFNFPLPKRFSLHISASAFGPNVGKEFVVKVGAERESFVLGARRSEVVLGFDNHGGESALEILVPNPVSPASLGVGKDQRVIGIGLSEIKIISD